MGLFKKNIQSRINGRRHAGPVVLPTDSGEAGDGFDTFPFLNAFEDPAQWEATTARMFADARNDPVFASVLQASYLEEDMEASFRRCINSPAPHAVSMLLNRLGLTRGAAIVDVGSGRGHFPYALSRLGHGDLTVMEPNDKWHTGTGYLRSLNDHRISFVGGFDEWRSIANRFDAAVSFGTVHHWQHIPQGMMDLRRTLKAGGYWIMAAEFFANSSREFLSAMYGHDTATRYNSYEWAYPASTYADMAESVGLKLAGVIPHHYRGNAFLASPSPDNIDHSGLDRWVDENLLSGTVEAFWDEVDAMRRTTGKRRRYYTHPQALIFRRVAPD